LAQARGFRAWRESATMFGYASGGRSTQGGAGDREEAVPLALGAGAASTSTIAAVRETDRRRLAFEAAETKAKRLQGGGKWLRNVKLRTTSGGGSASSTRNLSFLPVPLVATLVVVGVLLFLGLVARSGEAGDPFDCPPQSTANGRVAGAYERDAAEVQCDEGFQITARAAKLRCLPSLRLCSATRKGHVRRPGVGRGWAAHSAEEQEDTVVMTDSQEVCASFHPGTFATETEHMSQRKALLAAAEVSDRAGEGGRQQGAEVDAATQSPEIKEGLCLVALVENSGW